MSKYKELLEDMQTIVKDQDKMTDSIDPSHPVQRVAALEVLVSKLVWVLNQTLRELAVKETP